MNSWRAWAQLVAEDRLAGLGRRDGHLRDRDRGQDPQDDHHDHDLDQVNAAAGPRRRAAAAAAAAVRGDEYWVVRVDIDHLVRGHAPGSRPLARGRPRARRAAARACRGPGVVTGRRRRGVRRRRRRRRRHSPPGARVVLRRAGGRAGQAGRRVTNPPAGVTPSGVTWSLRRCWSRRWSPWLRSCRSRNRKPSPCSPHRRWRRRSRASSAGSRSGPRSRGRTCSRWPRP